MKLSATPNPAKNSGQEVPVPDELRPNVIPMGASELSCRHYDFGYILQQHFPIGHHTLYRFVVQTERKITVYAHHDSPFIGVLYNTRGAFSCMLQTELYISTKKGDYGAFYSPPWVNEIMIEPSIMSAVLLVLAPDSLMQSIADFSPPIQLLLQQLTQQERQGNALTLLRMNSRVKEQIRLIGLFDETSQHPEFYFQGILYNLLTELARQLHSQQQPVGPQEKSKDKMKRVYEFIVAQPNLRTCTMEYLSQLAGVSEANLRKLFRQVYDQPIQQFVRQQCLQKAARMLQESASYRLEDIAFEVGYANQANLSNAFKALFGIYPQEFRRKNQR